MEPNFKTLPLDYHPQRNDFSFGEIKFSSKFDSGNMLNVIKLDDYNYNLFISQDCNGTVQEYVYRTWFYFGIFGAKDKKLTINICNMNNQLRVFEDGYKIVYRRVCENDNLYSEDSYCEGEEYQWKRLDTYIKAQFIAEDKKTIQVTFSFDFDSNDEKGVLFSLCFPWSYTKNQKFLEFLEAQEICSKSENIYYHREKLTSSKEQRRIDLITISSFDNMTNLREQKLKNLFPGVKHRCFAFSKEKPIIFISARVHPGESPSSYLMNGIIKILIDKIDPRAKILRKFFVFKIIPIINVDGVSRGYYRFDTNSLNMNRHYINPNIKEQPEIYAIRRLFLYYSQEYKLRYYFDLHGHVTSRGLFLFGNSLDFLSQVENCMLPKLIELNCEFLKFENCNFKEKCMKSKEKGDKNSKEGTGRVHFNKCTDIIHAYTIEASYYKANFKNTLLPCNGDSKKIAKPLKDCKDFSNLETFSHENIFLEDRMPASTNSLHIPPCYEKMGISLLISILDYEELNPYSRVYNSEYENIYNLRKIISNKILKDDDKFKSNIINQNLNKDINSVKKFTSLCEKHLNHLNANNKLQKIRNSGINLAKRRNSSKDKTPTTLNTQYSTNNTEKIEAIKNHSLQPFLRKNFNSKNYETEQKNLKESYKSLNTNANPVINHVQLHNQFKVNNLVKNNLMHLKGNIFNKLERMDQLEKSGNLLKNKSSNKKDSSLNIKKLELNGGGTSRILSLSGNTEKVKINEGLLPKI